MSFFKRISFTIGLVALSIPEAVSSPYTISDDRVRSLDITPVLGRGYSIMTNMFHSTCLAVEDVTQPSYNYDYTLTNFFTGTDRASDLEGELSASLGIGPIKGAVSGSFSTSSKQSGESQIIVASMKLERYYSSVREESSPLAADAFTLLDRQDYVGFFKACGPNYVRGIRRAQEIVAIFKFFSSSVEKAKSFAMALSVSAVVVSASGSGASKSKFKSITNSLEIEIHGYGMGLNQNSAETLVATSLEEYNEVLKYAFRSFTQSEDSYQIGMVYGIEVVPWVNNVAFQVASKLHDENVEIPITRSLIQKSYHLNTGSTKKNSTWIKTNRANYKCKNSFYVIDKFGYCCEIDSLYDYTLKVYDNQNTDSTITLNQRICRPIRALDKALVKDNMSANGEFVARLDAALRFRLNQISTLERCVSATRAQPSRYLYNILKSQDTVKYDKTIPVKFTLAQLKATVDPLNDYGMVEHMGKELDEWIEMYYSPCLAALFGSNIESSPSVDPQYFMAYPWHTHSECMMLSCMSTNQRWNRESGGCVPSLINGASSTSYSNTDSECSKNTDDNDEDDEKCKYESADLIEYEEKVKKCWGKTISGSLFYMIEQFCMPQLTSEIAEDKTAIKDSIDDGCEIDLPAL